MSVKIIAHPETKKLFTATSKEGWVKCQVKSQQAVVSNGVITLQTRVAFPLIQQEVVESDLFNNLKDGSNFPLSGKIIRKVTAEPQFEGHQAVVNPETGETMNYYSTYDFTSNMNAGDLGSPQQPYVEEEAKQEETKTVEQSQM